MERAVAMFAQWREGGRAFKPDMVMAFVRECTLSLFPPPSVLARLFLICL